jgi:hypothetical protein
MKERLSSTFQVLRFDSFTYFYLYILLYFYSFITFQKTKMEGSCTFTLMNNYFLKLDDLKNNKNEYEYKNIGIEVQK